MNPFAQMDTTNHIQKVQARSKPDTTPYPLANNPTNFPLQDLNFAAPWPTSSLITWEDETQIKVAGTSFLLF